MVSAIAHLKRAGLNSDMMKTHFASFLADKGYCDLAAYWCGQPGGRQLFAQAVGQFFLRIPLADVTSLTLQQAVAVGMVGEAFFTYYGAPNQNREIDEYFANRGQSQDYDPFLDGETRQHAPRFFSHQGFRLPSGPMGQIATTPIVIVGAGAAGILTARMCIDAGFRDVRVLDMAPEYGGIWRQKNVRQGSRNNPLSFGYDRWRVEAAPGKGEEITRFLQELVAPPPMWGRSPLPPLERARVTRIEPGDLCHRVYCERHDGPGMVIETPLLVAALGQGRALPPSRPGVMTTDAPSYRAGIRWQQQISPEQARAWVGKTIVLIGLGNSTAEMLLQLQKYQDAGLDIRYKVVTHYPSRALRYPGTSEFEDEKEYRLYRDISAPHFKNLAGDLEHVRQAFERALHSRDRDKAEILSNIVEWHWESEQELVVVPSNGARRVIPCHQLYTLIGYGHEQKDMEALGLHVIDSYTGAVASDYDGEFQGLPLQTGRERLYPGYFGLGAVLKSSTNGDAQVVPDMTQRLSDLFFGLYMRAAEYALLSNHR